MANPILSSDDSIHKPTKWHQRYMDVAIEAIEGRAPDKTWKPVNLFAFSQDMRQMGKGDLGGEYAFSEEERAILTQGAAILRDAYINEWRTDRPADPGYVYLMRADTPEVNWYKIGLSIDPEFRLKTFNAIKLPFEMELVCVIQTPSMRELESQLHGWFADRRLRGEWFSLSEDDVEFIEGLAS